LSTPPPPPPPHHQKNESSSSPIHVAQKGSVALDFSSPVFPGSFFEQPLLIDERERKTTERGEEDNEDEKEQYQDDEGEAIVIVPKEHSHLTSSAKSKGEKNYHQCTGKEILYRPLWSPNEVESCELCGKKFTLITRRHHCRMCARCVCSNCSPSLLELRELGYSKKGISFIFFPFLKIYFLSFSARLHCV
jgi:superfamily II helicase